MKRCWPLLLLLIASPAGAQSYTLSGNAPMNGLVGPQGSLTAQANLLSPVGTTDFTAACPSQGYINRTQDGQPNNASSSVTLLQPAQAAAGDFDLVFCTDMIQHMTAPSGWIPIQGTAADSMGDITNAWERIIQTGDPPSWTWTGGVWPKCVLKDFRGFTGTDAHSPIPPSPASNGNAVIIAPPMPATANNCEMYVLYTAQRGGPATLSSLGGLAASGAYGQLTLFSSSGLSEITSDTNSWSTLDADNLIPTIGTIPTTGIGVYSSDQFDMWTGYEVTLHP